jgi:hypothetical protein
MAKQYQETACVNGKSAPVILRILCLASAAISWPAAAATVTNTFLFTYTNRTALISDGWHFLATVPAGETRNTEITNPPPGAAISYDQTNHPGVLRIPVDIGDLWGGGTNANNAHNMLFHPISSNWVSLVLDLSFTPTSSTQQAQLALYQDDDNYVEVGHAFNPILGGEVVTLAREDGGVNPSWSPLSISHVNVSTNRLQLRLDRDLVRDTVAGSYSRDGTNWTSLGSVYQALVNPQVCLWTGGSAGGYPPCDLYRLDVITSTTPVNPMLVSSPQHLVFSATAGQPCTNLQQLRVLARRTQAPQLFSVGSDSAWLSANVVSNTTPGYCDVSVNTAGLADGVYQGTLSVTAPDAQASATTVTLIVNPAGRARVANWRGAKAGAMTVWIDDSQLVAFDELSTNGFAGTYLLYETTPIPPAFTNYYQAGMELGGHTVDHISLITNNSEPAIRFELETNIADIIAKTPEPLQDLITFAFPRGDAPIQAQVAAADYYLAIHSYNVNQMEDPSPYNFMYLKCFNSHEHPPDSPKNFIPLVDAAISQGKWFNMVLHTMNNSDGAISYAVGKDIWVAPGGKVAKYIQMRDRTILTNYQEAAGQIRFDFYRLPLEVSSMRSFETAVGSQDLLTFQIDVTDTLSLYTLTIGSNPVSCSPKALNGRTLLVFDTPVTTNAQTAILQIVSNRPPSLPTHASRSLRQLETLALANAAIDPDSPPQLLRYALLAPPTGAQVDANGLIQWTPGVNQPPGDYLLTTVAADNGLAPGPLSATNILTVTVLPQNVLVLPTVANVTISSGQDLAVTNTATYTRTFPPWFTNTTFFSYTDRDALLADGWTFIATNGASLTNPVAWTPRNTENLNPAAGAVVSYDQSAHPGILRIPCDQGDLWGPGGSSRNALFRNLPPGWVTVQVNVNFAPAQNTQQVQLSLYQTDDNYLQTGFAFNSSLGGQVATVVLETNPTPVFATFPLIFAMTNILLRLERDSSGTNVTSSFSVDLQHWMTLGTFQPLFPNPRLSIWSGGNPAASTNGPPYLDLRRLDVVASNTPPRLLTYTLLNPPLGATIDSAGIVRWTPTLGQAPGTYTLTTIVSDNPGTAVAISATNSFVASVGSPITVNSKRNADGTAAFFVQGAANTTWILQATTNLTLLGSWVNVSTNTAGADGVCSVTVSPIDPPQRFYRWVSP